MDYFFILCCIQRNLVVEISEKRVVETQTNYWYIKIWWVRVVIVHTPHKIHFNVANADLLRHYSLA